jgi:hypothetical protein
VTARNLILAFNSATFLVSIWSHFFTILAQGHNILDHPDYNPNGPHFLVYDPAIIDVATPSYIDVMIILDRIQALHIDGEKNRFKVMFVVGDQQTYERMCILLMDHPERYRWCIPMNGDFHFVAHVVAAFHILYFRPFTAWIARKLGFDKVIKEGDDNVTNFKHYDHFYLLVTAAITRLLLEIVEPALLAFPSTLLERVKNNAGNATMLSFLSALLCLTSLTSLPIKLHT